VAVIGILLFLGLDGLLMWACGERISGLAHADLPAPGLTYLAMFLNRKLSLRLTGTTRKKRQFWAYELEEEELPTEPAPLRLQTSKGDEGTHQGQLGIMLGTHYS
jgi:hypothetical protein